MTMLIVLDLDNTLVFTSNVWKNRCPHYTFKLSGIIYHIYLRPGIIDFLKYIFTYYEVGVWTAATRDYASCILQRLLGKTWKKQLRRSFFKAN